MLDLGIDRERLATICERYGIARLDVFGSAARGDDAPGSDIDLLYYVSPGRSLGWEIADLAQELQRFLGRPVDLVSPPALHPLNRDQVLADAEMLYAAA